VKFSACGENNWPYDITKFAVKPPQHCYNAAKTHKQLKAINISANDIAIKTCLVSGFPVSFGAALFESFMTEKVAQTGIIPVPNIKTEQRVGGHCMTIVGYDDSKNAFLVSNSWSVKWGIKGFCWFPYKYMLNKTLVSDFWSFRLA
jgi:C1A family cysteine protease